MFHFAIVLLAMSLRLARSLAFFFFLEGGWGFGVGALAEKLHRLYLLPVYRILSRHVPAQPQQALSS